MGKIQSGVAPAPSAKVTVPPRTVRAALEGVALPCEEPVWPLPPEQAASSSEMPAATAAVRARWGPAPRPRPIPVGVMGHHSLAHGGRTSGIAHLVLTTCRFSARLRPCLGVHPAHPAEVAPGAGGGRSGR